MTRRASLRSLASFGALGWAFRGWPARADSALDFTLRNRLGVSITEFYMSPHQTSDWEDNIVKRGIIADGRETNIRFNASDVGRGDIWDMKVVTSDDRTFIWTNPGFKLRQIQEITVFMRNGNATAESR